MIEDEQNAETGLTKKFEEQLFDQSIDLGSDYADLGLENMLDNELLKHIPFVKTLVAFYHIGSSYNARHNVKKILVFLQAFHSKTIEPQKLTEFKNKFDKNPKFRDRVMETVLVYNEKFIEVSQSAVLAHLFRAYIEGKIEWGSFSQLAFIVNNLHPIAYESLEVMEVTGWANHDRHPAIEALMLSAGIGHRHGTSFSITETGRQLYDYGIKPMRGNSH